MKRRSSRLQRSIVIFGLAILVVVSLFAIKKTPQIANKVGQFAKTVEHKIQWDLNPGSTVTAIEGARTQPLSPLRSNLMMGPLRVNTTNRRYFTNDSGKAIFLTGSHIWQNLQDSGNSHPLPTFNYAAYLDFLAANNHNFFRLWTWEQPRWSLDSPNDNFRFSPMPYQRIGTELATDGLPKFDLSRFDRDYFDRLRGRVIAAKNRGIYVSIMLFNGWSVAADKNVAGGKNPWQSHPFNGDNNINSINGDLNGDKSGEEVHELVIPEIAKIQAAYVRKVIDTVNDLDNVLYEISNESHQGATQWQYHLIDLIKSYEAGKPKQHPVGMTVEYPQGDNSALFASPADWISLNGDVHHPPVADGRKVILADTDHLCGVCGNSQWVWKSFTRGENPIYMDVYDGAFDLIVERVPPDPLTYKPWVNIRRNLGYTLTYARRMNMAAMLPRPDLASTGYVLANPTPKDTEYLVYVPSGGKVTVDLSIVNGELRGEWLNPNTGITINGVKTTGGGRRSFSSPFDGDSVLYLSSKKLTSLSK
jgi:hypothetical protein